MLSEAKFSVTCDLCPCGYQVLFLIQKFSHRQYTDFEVLEEDEGVVVEGTDGLDKISPVHGRHHGAMVLHLHSVRLGDDGELVQQLGKVGQLVQLQHQGFHQQEVLQLAQLYRFQ